MANYSNLKAAIADVIKTNGTKAITGQVLQDTLNSIVSVIGANYQFAGVATPSTNPGTPDQNVFYVAMQGGTYTNFNATALPEGISLLMWNGSWSSQVISYNDGGVFDISVYKSTGGTLATFADLAAALGTNGANVPVAARKGGMSVRFVQSSVQSSDNKYVQYRLMAALWSTTVSDWQGVDTEPILGSHNLVESGGVFSKLSRKEYGQLTLVGYINPSGAYIAGELFNHKSSDFIPVKRGAIIGIKNTVRVGGDAIKCAYYTETKEFVSEKNNGDVIPSDGYVRFCCNDATYTSDSFWIVIEIQLQTMYEDVEQLKHDVAILKQKDGKVVLYYLPNLDGYISKVDGSYVEGSVFNHYATDFIEVFSGNIIHIGSDVHVGGDATKCAYYNASKEFVSNLDDGAVIPNDGYVRFCYGNTAISDKSFGVEQELYIIIEKIEQQIESIINEINDTIINDKNGSIEKRMIDNELADFGLPSWIGKIGMRTTDLMPSINNAGQAYLIDNNGDLELRVIKDAVNIVGCTLIQKKSNVISPASFSMCHFGDSITYGVGSNPNYVTRLKTLLETDGHTITLQTNLGISGTTAEGVYNTYKNIEAVHHDIATYMIGINDQDRWLRNKNPQWETVGLKADEFREWFRTNLRLSIDTIIRYSTCNKLFLIVPYWSVIEMRSGSPYPSEWAYYSQPLQNVVIQEVISAAKDYGAHLCRADYYVPNSYDYIPDGLHANNAGAQLLAEGLRNEITFRASD